MDQRTVSPAQPATTTLSATPIVKPSVEGSVKETLESILVAFILAFIFRAFVVEAFVIPTGSMAPTLLGAHMRFRCPDCGYRFDVNFQGKEGTGSDDLRIPAVAENRVFAIFCPNCGYRLPRVDADDPANDASSPAVRYGDRILVLKYLYLFQEPQRWDVVVFKSPFEPARHNYTQNYIKRLVGKPGETMMILDGDVYVGEGDDLSTFQVQTKPWKVQEALWRIVHDNDYHPRGLPRAVTRSWGDIVGVDPTWQQPWKQQPGQTGWDIDGRTVRFKNLSGSSALFFDASANPTKYAMTDWLAYDATLALGPRDEADTYLRPGPQPTSAVSDVKLEFFYQRHEGAGPLRLQITKLGHTLEAQIEPGSALLKIDDRSLGRSAQLAESFATPVKVELVSADYRFALRIAGREVLSSTPQQLRPDVQALLAAYRAGRQSPPAAVRIIGQNQSCSLSHLKLWRDVYYLNRDHNAAPLRWASPHDLPARLIHLGPDEFFVLGDNSLISMDARYWEQPIDLPHEKLHVSPGRVPRRFMLGKAFFVYWPAGYRPMRGAPALIPNFGDLRFIH